jgi:antitoxin component of MazEF toxin-antitoxin module
VTESVQTSVETTVNQWGNGLAVRINKAIAKAAGVTEGSHVHIVASPGRIVIDLATKEPTLEEMLAAFDPQLHGGEMMAFPPAGVEVF